MVLPNDVDLLNPPAELEKRKHKLKRLVQSPNSFFMDVKCQGCFNIVQPLTNCGGVWELPDRAVSADWGSCPAHGGLLLQEKG
ncbi:40S ribosomal S27-2 [Olea europaea subsp. europaea]|nr:40S ribosomal S27-2 [Olea europaea subsp. europaea]